MLNTNTFKGVIMNKIKKGDWVYSNENGGHVFQCSGTRDEDEIIIGGDHWWLEEYCHRLEPLRLGDKLSPRDRVAMIRRGPGDPELGTIHRIVRIDTDEFIFPVIDSTECGRAMLLSELARLPDCAQDKRCETSDGKETHCADDDDQSIPYVLTSKSVDNRLGPDSEAPCPHPEWEGIWKTRSGTIVHARWVPDNGPKGRWEIKGDASIFWWNWDGPSDSWTQIEPAPYASRPGPKLERPRKHGGIKTPWNPWEI